MWELCKVHLNTVVETCGLLERQPQPYLLQTLRSKRSWHVKAMGYSISAVKHESKKTTHGLEHETVYGL
jgi:hypothetical protein